MTKAQFADLMEIDPNRLLIGESQVNLARKGRTAQLARVWGNKIALFFTLTRPSNRRMVRLSVGALVLSWASVSLG
ncbi:hypothetical protein MNL10_06315 [Bartonella krasnovii]|nr:hypothetical protein [Bartonella krasnovii]UNF38357.1 hypothetical protein MNL10_06315 [Bartonella krasnovii]